MGSVVGENDKKTSLEKGDRFRLPLGVFRLLFAQALFSAGLFPLSREFSLLLLLLLLLFVVLRLLLLVHLLVFTRVFIPDRCCARVSFPSFRCSFRRSLLRLFLGSLLCSLARSLDRPVSTRKRGKQKIWMAVQNQCFNFVESPLCDERFSSVFPFSYKSHLSVLTSEIRKGCNRCQMTRRHSVFKRRPCCTQATNATDQSASLPPASTRQSGKACEGRTNVLRQPTKPNQKGSALPLSLVVLLLPTAGTQTTNAHTHPPTHGQPPKRSIVGL